MPKVMDFECLKAKAPISPSLLLRLRQKIFMESQYSRSYSSPAHYKSAMALYYDAASILSSTETSGSLKSRIYSNTTLKSKPAQIYALISETAKRDVFLKEVLDNTDLLKDEPKVGYTTSDLT